MKEPIDIEREKKKNLRLAIGVAALGVSGFTVLYLILVVIMVASPFTIFRFFPDISWTENAIGIDQKLLLFSKHLDFKDATRDSPPQEKTTIAIFDGHALSGRTNINPFSSVYPVKDKAYFFTEGRYLTFDGQAWETVEQTAIGSAPRGAVGEAGIWVLSWVEERPILSLLAGSSVREIPLPEEALTDICSAQIVSVGKGLLLFWKKNPSLFWSEYNGSGWSPPSSFDHAGQYRAIPADNSSIFLFQTSQVGGRSKITVRAFTHAVWSEPTTYELDFFSFHVIPVLFRNTPALLTQGFFAQSYFFIDQNQPRGPFPLQKQFFFFGSFLKFLTFIISANLLTVLAVYLLSALIGKFKLRTWQTDFGKYEFASLFRRFLAKTIDAFIILVPVCAVLYGSLSERMLNTDPFRFIAIALSGVLMVIVGGFLYHAFLEGIWGKTPGKKICGILVLKDDFTRCTLGPAFIRNLMRLVDNMFYYLVGITTMAGTMKWQRLGDLVAETIVVKENTSPEASVGRKIQA